MHFGRIHRADRLNWITELKGDEPDDLIPSAISPAGLRILSDHRATNIGTAQDLEDRLLGPHECDSEGGPSGISVGHTGSG